HGTVAVPSSTHVVDLRLPRCAEELHEGGDEIRAVDVIAYLLAAVAEYGIGCAGDGAAHEIAQEAVQFGGGVTRAGEASAAEAGGAHTEIAAVLLDHDVGRHLARAENAVPRRVYGHRLGNTGGIRVRRVDFPSGLQFHQ